MNVSDRLIEYCEREKIRQIDLVNLGCGTAATVNKIFKRKQEPSSKFLEIFLQWNRKCPARWLLTGKGEQDIVEDPKAQYGFCKECIKKEGVIEHLKKECQAKDRRILELEIKIAGAEGRVKSQAG
jgi:hypothetical protein